MTTNFRGPAGLLVAILAIVFSASPAAAHTGFESSSPADGDMINEPITEITLTFSGEATPAGEGFIVLDPDGTIRTPDEITTNDNLTWTLRFNEPLAGGDGGVRWMVAAPDAHPIDGSFSFTVTAPAPTGDEELAQDSELDEPAAVPDESASSTEPTADETASAEASTDTNPTANDQVAPGEVDAAVETEPVDLESFLDNGDAKPTGVDGIAATARVLSIVGTVLVIGGAAFAAFGLRGDASDTRAVLDWLRRGGVLVAVGAVIEAATTTVTLAGGWSALTSMTSLSNALWSTTGLAIALRASGGMLTATRIGVSTTIAQAAGDPVVAARQLAMVGGGRSNPLPSHQNADEPFVYPDDHVWDASRSLVGLVGIALVAASFMFDGHTASEGPRLLHAVANLTHVTTAAIWTGGVAMLVLTMQRRRSDNRPTQALQLAMRFSVVATVALVAAGLAGLALSIVVLDSISEIWSTPWGRLLMLKVALVAAAAAGGAYNHRIVVPALDQNPDDQPTIDRFRSVVTFEAAALVAVVIATAFLIGASST